MGGSKLANRFRFRMDPWWAADVVHRGVGRRARGARGLSHSLVPDVQCNYLVDKRTIPYQSNLRFMWVIGRDSARINSDESS
jgi:hypothetical protein